MSPDREGREGIPKGNPEWGINKVGQAGRKAQGELCGGPEVRGELERQMQTGGGGHTLQVNMPGF